MDDSQGKPHNLNWSEEMYKLIEDMFDADTFEGKQTHFRGYYNCMMVSMSIKLINSSEFDPRWRKCHQTFVW